MPTPPLVRLKSRRICDAAPTAVRRAMSQFTVGLGDSAGYGVSRQFHIPTNSPLVPGDEASRTVIHKQNLSFQ